MYSFDRESLGLLEAALEALDVGFSELPEATAELDLEALGSVLAETARRLRDNYPYFHPLYVGQMLKPPHAIARLAYALSLWINPNNHALDGGRASSAMEEEAVAELARMFGWKAHLGHLCGGGTMANLEALWVAREKSGGGAVLASDQAHYTHERLSHVLGVPFRRVATDARGRMDEGALERELAAGDVGCVVATMGTTGLGAVDPLAAIIDHARTAGARVHADAAYGGYFRLASTLTLEVREAFDALVDVDSLVVDPHKHGLQPYGCGCILLRDPEDGRVYSHDSPYTYFSSSALHLGEISLECSRPGAAAVALWATQRLLPYEVGGAFAQDLDACLAGARALHERLSTHARFAPLFPPQLDIVTFAVRAPDPEAVSSAARRVFDAAALEDLHLALASFPDTLLAGALPDVDAQGSEVTCLRACVMKPEHRDWLEDILERLDRAVASVVT